MEFEAVENPYHYFWFNEQTGNWVYMDSIPTPPGSNVSEIVDYLAW